MLLAFIYWHSLVLTLISIKTENANLFGQKLHHFTHYSLVVPYAIDSSSYSPKQKLFREALKKLHYSDIVPISFYTHPPEGNMDSNYRDKINVISTPSNPVLMLNPNPHSQSDSPILI